MIVLAAETACDFGGNDKVSGGRADKPGQPDEDFTVDVVHVVFPVDYSRRANEVDLIFLPLREKPNDDSQFGIGFP